MKLSIAQDEGSVVRVLLTGHVTQSELDPLQDPLIDLLGPGGYSKTVRLDLSEVSHVDSSGIGWLLSCHKRIKQAGGRLMLERLHPLAANVIRILKLERVFELSDDAGPASGSRGVA
jgi:anti-sigma B factor antagonist